MKKITLSIGAALFGAYIATIILEFGFKEVVLAVYKCWIGFGWLLSLLIILLGIGAFDEDEEKTT